MSEYEDLAPLFVDEMTPLERAQIDVEHAVWDLSEILKQLNAWRFDAAHMPFFPAQEAMLCSAMTSVQLLCSSLKADREAFDRSNVIPMKGASRG